MPLYWTGPLLAGGHCTPCDPSPSYSVVRNSDSPISTDLLILQVKRFPDFLIKLDQTLIMQLGFQKCSKVLLHIEV